MARKASSAWTCAGSPRSGAMAASCAPGWLDLTARALAENPTLENVIPYVADSGEGRWTAIEAINQGCPTPVITLALQRRFMSQEESSFSDQLLAVMREQSAGTGEAQGVTRHGRRLDYSIVIFGASAT